MESYNFVWILVGGNFDIHNGNLIKYALVEHCSGGKKYIKVY